MSALDRIFRRRQGQQRPLESYVRGLWRGGEQGVWYDPSDLTTLSQDTAGQTPVYMPGQGQADPPVGLLLDKRRARGGGLFSDGAVAFAGPSTRVSPGVYRIYSAAGEYSSCGLLPAGAVVGRWYELMFSVDSIAVVGAGLALDGASALSNGPSISTVGRKAFIIQAASSSIGVKRSSSAIDYQISDVSIRELPGNHAYQSTATSRPTLSARYNLLTNTGWSGAAAGSPGVTPTGWALGFGTASITAVTQVGSDNAIQITAANTRLFFSQPFTAAINTTYSISMLVVENTSMSMVQLLGLTGQPSGSTVAYYINGASATASSVPSPGAWIELRLLNGATAGTPEARFGLGATGPVTGVVAVARPDVRVKGDGVGLPTYQRVVDANTYDTDGFPLYLKFDGVDDSLQTASIDFSGSDKLFICAAARKISDPAAGMLVELSASIGTYAGSFYLSAPETTDGSQRFRSRGSLSGNTTVSTGSVPAPASFVLTGIADIGGMRKAIRLNGTLKGTSSEDQGVGSFGNYPLYIGRRGGSSIPFNGRIYGLIIRGAATPDPTISRVERHLNAKSRAY